MDNHRAVRQCGRTSANPHLSDALRASFTTPAGDATLSLTTAADEARLGAAATLPLPERGFLAGAVAVGAAGCSTATAAGLTSSRAGKGRSLIRKPMLFKHR